MFRTCIAAIAVMVEYLSLYQFVFHLIHKWWTGSRNFLKSSGLSRNQWFKPANPAAKLFTMVAGPSVNKPSAIVASNPSLNKIPPWLQVVGVRVDQELFDSYYHGCCKACFWPLFHSMPDRALFKKDPWEVGFILLLIMIIIVIFNIINWALFKKGPWEVRLYFIINYHYYYCNI